MREEESNSRGLPVLVEELRRRSRTPEAGIEVIGAWGGSGKLVVQVLAGLSWGDIRKKRGWGRNEGRREKKEKEKEDGRKKNKKKGKGKKRTKKKERKNLFRVARVYETWLESSSFLK